MSLYLRLLSPILVRFVGNNVTCIVYSVQCTVYSVQCTVYSGVYSVHCTVSTAVVSTTTVSLKGHCMGLNLPLVTAKFGRPARGSTVST